MRAGGTVWLIALSLLSCSDGGGGGSGTGGSGGGGGGGTSGGGGASGGGGGATGGTAGTGTGGTGGALDDCTHFANPAPLIQSALSSAPAPTPMGGDIQSGTYYLTSSTYHQTTGACQLHSFRGTLFVDRTSSTEGTSRESFDVADPANNYRSRFRYTTSGTLQRLNPMAPCLPNSISRSYTATATTLAFIYVPGSSCGYSVETYTKQ